MTLPELHGWLPASALARREGVSPSTIRRRAVSGAYDVIPNPLGAGALYRPAGADPSYLSIPVCASGPNRANPVAVVVRDLSAVERLTLGQGQVSVTELAGELGLSRATAHRTLCRMEQRGYLRRLGESRPGPRGGRPRIIWTAGAVT